MGSTILNNTVIKSTNPTTAIGIRTGNISICNNTIYNSSLVYSCDCADSIIFVTITLSIYQRENFRQNDFGKDIAFYFTSCTGIKNSYKTKLLQNKKILLFQRDILFPVFLRTAPFYPGEYFGVVVGVCES